MVSFFLARPRVRKLGKPGHVPQGRARQAARAALACTLAEALVLLPLPASVREWLPVGTSVVAPAVAFLASGRSRGEVAQVALVIGLSAPALFALGVIVSYLCYIAAGFTWQPWVLYASLPPMMFALTIWSKAAALRRLPRPCYVADPTILWLAALVPVLMCNGGTAVAPLRVAVSLLVTCEVATTLALLCSYLPRIGTVPASSHIPSLLAANLGMLADYIEALALRRGRDHAPASVYRRREIRAETLFFAANLRRECTNGVHEGCEQSPLLQRAMASAERCRLALQLKHYTQVSASRSHPAAELMDALQFRGELGEARLDLALTASTALRAAANLMVQSVGLPTVGEAPGAPEMGTERVSVEECRAASKECLDLLAKDMELWRDFHSHTFKARLEAVARKHSPVAELLSQLATAEDESRSAHETLFSNYLDDAVVFQELGRAAATHFSIQTMAEEAAAIASLTADWHEDVEGPLQRRLRCWHSSGGVGLRAWLFAPFAGCKVWRAALAESWRFGLRLAVAFTLAGLIGLTCPFLWIEQANYGFWTVVTLGICMLPVQGAAVLKAAHRFCGTVFGAALGIASSLLAASSELTLWCHVLALAFALKFFDRELQYAGSTCFITYAVVVQALVAEDEGFGQRFGWSWQSYEAVFSVAAFRVLSVGLGVVLAVLVSVFVAPTRAVDVLRSLEQDALGAVADVVRATARALARSALAARQGAAGGEGGGALGAERPGQGLKEVHARLVDLKEAIFFGGDGLPGVGDTLSEAKLEFYIGAGAGAPLGGGLLWLPGALCRRGGGGRRRRGGAEAESAPLDGCIRAVPALSRLLRVADLLLSLVSGGIEQGCERLLDEERVLEALGPEGSRLSRPAALGVAALAARASLRGGDRCLAERAYRCAHADGIEEEAAAVEEEEEPRRGRGRGGAEEEAGAAAAARGGGLPRDHLAVAGLRLELLAEGALASRRAAGGAMGPNCQAGGIRVAAILLLLREVFRSLSIVQKELEGDGFPSEAISPALPDSTDPEMGIERHPSSRAASQQSC